MARSTYEKTQVFFLDTIADPDAPTEAEIALGDDLTSQIPVDGIAFNGARNNAAQAMLGDAFVTEEPGTWSQGVTLTFVRDTENDAARALFLYNTRGYLVFSPFGAPVDGAQVDVYPVAAHEPNDLASAENEYEKYEVTFAVTATPSLRATVAAS